MKDIEIYGKAQISIDQERPFVLYRKPATSILSGFFQKDHKSYKSKDLKETGFVMESFEALENPYFIPLKNADFFQVTIDRQLNNASNSIEDSNHTHQIASQEAYEYLIQKTINTIRKTNLSKVVLSRKESVVYKASIFEIFSILESLYPDAFCYLWYHPATGCWTGATPETLLSYNGKIYSTMSLAGTRRANPSSAIEWGAKEIEEQTIVTNAIVKTLEKYTNNINLSEPETARAGNLEHLKTKITGIISNDYFGDLVKALHPTPAVCGTPKEEARKFILKNETYDREFYTGYLGPVNIKKSQDSMPLSDLYVNLRCMKLENKTASIYVGGGITSESIPSAEWKETVNKSMTMKRVLNSLGNYDFKNL